VIDVDFEELMDRTPVELAQQFGVDQLALHQVDTIPTLLHFPKNEDKRSLKQVLSENAVSDTWLLTEHPVYESRILAVVVNGECIPPGHEDISNYETLFGIPITRNYF